MDSSKMIGDFHEVSMNINRLFLKINRFICNLVVGSLHSLSQTPITPKKFPSSSNREIGGDYVEN